MACKPVVVFFRRFRFACSSSVVCCCCSSVASGPELLLPAPIAKARGFLGRLGFPLISFLVYLRHRVQWISIVVGVKVEGREGEEARGVECACTFDILDLDLVFEFGRLFVADNSLISAFRPGTRLALQTAHVWSFVLSCWLVVVVVAVLVSWIASSRHCSMRCADVAGACVA